MLTLKEPSLEEVGYGIDVDEFNIILYRLKLNKTGNNVGQLRREAMGYYNSVEACLEKVYLLEVQRVGLADLEALNKDVRLTIASCAQSWQWTYGALQATYSATPHASLYEFREQYQYTPTQTPLW